MSIILLETPHSREPRESTRQLIAMEHTKVSHPQRQLPPRPRSVVKHETVEEGRKREGGREEEGGRKGCRKRMGDGEGTNKKREQRDRVRKEEQRCLQ